MAFLFVVATLGALIVVDAIARARLRVVTSAPDGSRIVALSSIDSVPRCDDNETASLRRHALPLVVEPTIETLFVTLCDAASLQPFAASLFVVQ